jgi:hypothetical protein
LFQADRREHWESRFHRPSSISAWTVAMAPPVIRSAGTADWVLIEQLHLCEFKLKLLFSLDMGSGKEITMVRRQSKNIFSCRSEFSRQSHNGWGNCLISMDCSQSPSAWTTAVRAPKEMLDGMPYGVGNSSSHLAARRCDGHFCSRRNAISLRSDRGCLS